MDAVYIVVVLSTLLCVHAQQDTVRPEEVILDHHFCNTDGWKHQVTFGGNTLEDDFMVFTKDRSNSFINNGKLVIKPALLEDKSNDTFVRQGELVLQGCTSFVAEQCVRRAIAFIILPPITSARLTTKDHFSFRYGTVEIRAKLPRGNWIVPELWLEPVIGPKTQRIVMGLARGNMDDSEYGSKTLEAGVMGQTDELSSMGKKRGNTPWTQNYHTFKINWKHDEIRFFVDDQQIHRIPSVNFSILSKEVYLTLGVHVAGRRDFNDSIADKPWGNTSPKGILKFWNDKSNWYPTWNDDSALQVDYVKVSPTDTIRPEEVILDHHFCNTDGWKHQVTIGGNTLEDDFMVFTKDRSNSFINNGKLVIKPALLEDKSNDTFVRQGELVLQGCTSFVAEQCVRRAIAFIILPPITSARLTTKDHFSFRYGTVEIRAKLPRGNWIVPELWLEPVIGPETQRIVMGLARGNMDDSEFGSKTLEAGVMGQTDELSSMGKIRGNTPWTQNYHTFKINWRPDEIRFFVDDQQIHRIPSVNFSILSKKVYLTLGVHVGGRRDFDDSIADKPWINLSPKGILKFWNDKSNWYPTWNNDSALQVDYVKVSLIGHYILNGFYLFSYK